MIASRFVSQESALNLDRLVPAVVGPVTIILTMDPATDAATVDRIAKAVCAAHPRARVATTVGKHSRIDCEIDAPDQGLRFVEWENRVHVIERVRAIWANVAGGAA